MEQLIALITDSKMQITLGEPSTIRAR